MNDGERRMDYDKQTKQYYQNDRKASEYFAWYTSAGGLNGYRFKYIASRERRVVKSLACKVPHSRVIDVPTGTGKMAKVFAELGSSVLACDISENMLQYAKRVYADEGVPAKFQVMELESATEVIREPYDLTVCVRLLHRVPEEVKKAMLREISVLSPFAIVSFGIDSVYERIRGRLRRLALSRGSDSDTMHRVVRATWCTHDEVLDLLREDFEVMEFRSVSRLFSSEKMYLVRSKRSKNYPSA